MWENFVSQSGSSRYLGAHGFGTYHDERKMSTSGGIIEVGVDLQDLIADRKSCFCGKDSRSCDLLINEPSTKYCMVATHIVRHN
jgi:hypothetical protein